LIRRMVRRAEAGLLEAVVHTMARPRAARPESPKSIFVLRNNDVGDVLAVTPLFDALRRRFPQARIAAGVGSWSAPVLEGNPHISETLKVEAPWFNKYTRGVGAAGRFAYILRSPEVEEIRSRNFDIGVDVVGTPWGSLLLSQAGIPYRLGVKGYAGGHTGVQGCVRYDPNESVSRSSLRFAEALGATDLPEARPQLFLSVEEREAGERLWSGDGKRRIVVGPGGGLAVKLWPREYYAALIQRLGELGDVESIVVGGPMERGLAEELTFGGARALSGLGLRETFALVATSHLVICNSSMLLHVAAAFRRPTVALLGPSFPSASAHQAQWGYPGTCVSLGRESNRDLATPDEALAAAREVTGW
jgi:ADP-heptose:LPS heptosyltransferase